MNVLSLFSGIGGLDLGLQRAGMTIAGQVEIDPWCRKVLAKHWPEVPRHDDVRTCAEWWGGRTAPDLVAGGFPCQPVSLAGLGLAQADSRWLWPAFAGTVRVLRPAFVLVENVPGLLGRGMGDVLGDLASLGYDAEWDCVPAAFVGAPHIRNRVWIVAYPAGARRAPGATGTGRPARDDARRPGPDGLGSHVADAAGGRWDDPRHYQFSEGQSDHTGAALESEPGRSRSAARDMADPERNGLERRRPAGGPSPQRAPAPCFRQRPATSGWWASEPGVGRVAHGIPRRVDRLRGLGNAVVPQVAEHIGRMIMAAAS